MQPLPALAFVQGTVASSVWRAHPVLQGNHFFFPSLALFILYCA